MDKMQNEEIAVNRGDTNLYLLSKENILEIELYSKTYIWILLAVLFVVLMSMGVILLLGLIFGYYFCCWIFSKAIGEPKKAKLLNSSVKEIKAKEKVNTISWESITKAEVKGQYLDLYVNDNRKGLFIKSDKKRMLDLLNLKLKDKLRINDSR